MSNLQVNAKNRFIELTESYRATADQMIEEEKAILESIKSDPSDAAQKKLNLADLMLNLASHYMVIDGVSQAVLNIRNEETLHDARKSINKSIGYMEEVVGNFIDAPYTEYEQNLLQIRTVSPARRYLLVRKTGLALQLLETAFGDNSKWKWSFVEIEGCYAAVAKNIFNIRDVMVNSNFESEHYESTVRHLALIKKLLMQTANRYREKYECFSESIDDFKKGILFLSALKRFDTLIGDQAEAVVARKKLDTWNAKLAADIEKREKEEKE